MLHEINQTVCAIVLGTVTTNKKQSDKVKPCTVVARDQSNSLCNCAVLLHQKERKKEFCMASD